MREWVLVVVAIAGCGTTTYGYQYKRQQQFSGGEEPEPAPREARELLANAKTVAFYPPAYCVAVDGGGDRQRQQEIHASCNVTISALERAAEDAGYEVVSWQNLRGSKPPIEYARDSHVDVLFEVNELETTVLDDTTVKHTFAFTEGDGDGTPLSISTNLGATCRDYALKADPPKAAALTGSIDIKTVAVSDGRDRWHYRRTEERGLDRSYPRVTFSAPNKQSALFRALMTVGAVGLGVGTGLALGEAASMDDPSTPQNEKVDTGGWSTNFLVIGGAATVAAIAVAVGTGGEKPDPEKVLCNGTFAVAQPAPPPQANVMASEQTFEQTSTGDALAEAKKQVMVRMTTQFIDQIKEAHAGMHLRQTAPPPAAPAPAAAVPAPAAAPAPAPAPAPVKP
jgi:hypothetical protein